MSTIEILHERANDALLKGNVDKAIEFYNMIVAESPTDEVALSQLMDIYLERDKFQYYLARANVNIAHSKLDHASNDVRKAINLEPESLEANIKLARIYKVAGKNLKAIDQFNHVLEIESKEQDSYVELVNLYMVEDAIQSAIGIAKRATETFPENDFFKNLLAKLYFDDGNFDEALEVVTDPIFEIKILLQKEDNDRAKEKLDKINPQALKKEEKPGYYILLAQYHYNQKDFEKALDAINKYIEFKEPDAVSFQMRALVYEGMDDEFSAAFNWGLCHKVRNKLEDAIISFVEAHQADPQNKDAMLELVSLYDRTGDKFVASEYRQKIYELDGDENAKKELAEFYYEQGDLNMARKYGKIIEKPEKSERSEKGFAPDVEDEGLLNKVLKWFKM